MSCAGRSNTHLEHPSELAVLPSSHRSTAPSRTPLPQADRERKEGLMHPRVAQFRVSGTGLLPAPDTAPLDPRVIAAADSTATESDDLVVLSKE